MNRAEDMLRQNESAEQEPGNESRPLEHIYILGIGVRDALGSDSPESPDFWCRFREESAQDNAGQSFCHAELRERQPCGLFAVGSGDERLYQI